MRTRVVYPPHPHGASVPDLPPASLPTAPSGRHRTGKLDGASAGWCRLVRPHPLRRRPSREAPTKAVRVSSGGESATTEGGGSLPHGGSWGCGGEAPAFAT